MTISSSGKALLAGISGTSLQWYDFALFGYFAPIIARTYFPHSNATASLLKTFGIFAVGYLLAPLGSLFFGYIGDYFGRKPALALSILGMAIPTALISLVPGYQAIGLAAPLIITLLRVIQGFVASAEFTGSSIFLVEHAKPDRKAFYGCFTSSAYSAGLMLAGLAASFFTASFMPSWAWRLGFALALVAGVVIFYLRSHVGETQAFLALSNHHKTRQPLFSAMKEAPLAFIGVIGLAWLTGIITFGTYVFSATYLTSYLAISLSHATLIITLALLVDALLEPFIALIADKIGFLKVIRVGMAAMLLLSIPVFYLLSTGAIVWISLGMVLMSIAIAITYAPMNAYMISLFPAHYRYSGLGVAFNFGMSLLGSTAPFVIMWLLNKTGNLIAPAWYYVFGTIIGFLSLNLCELSRNKVSTQQAIVF